MSVAAPVTLKAATTWRRPSALALHGCLMWAAALSLGVLAAIELALTAAMLLYPGELMYGEAILSDHARRIVEGVSLYQPIDRLPYTVAAYTPLFYWLAGAAQVLFGAALAPGRALALLALLVATALVGYLATLEGRGWRTGLLASVIFFALGAPGSGVIPWTALYKEDSLALALTLGSLCLVARGQRSRVMLAAMLSALAILTKQTYAAAIIGELVWVFLRDRRLGCAMLVGILLPVIGLSALLEATTGAFVANTVLANINPFRMDWLVSNLLLLVLFQAGPMLAAAVGLLASRRRISSMQGLMLLSWLSAGIPVLAIAKLGGASNHWLMFAAVGAILAAWAIVPGHATARPRLSHWIATTALAGGLLAVAPVAASTWLTSLDAIRSSTESANRLEQLVERLRTEQRTVLADPVDVVVLAGKHPLFEPLLLSIFAADGRWDVQPIVDQVCSGQIGLLVVDRPISDLDWPEPLRAALLAGMHSEGSTAGRLVYAADSTPSGEACN